MFDVLLPALTDVFLLEALIPAERPLEDGADALATAAADFFFFVPRFFVLLVDFFGATKVRLDAAAAGAAGSRASSLFDL